MIIKHNLSGDAGELSPWLDSRTDLAKYAGGFRTLRNFMVLPQGGVTKRPGMEKRGAITESADTGRLIEFQIASDHAAILALGGGQMRFWINGDMVTVADAPYFTAIPWLDGDLEKLRWRQINDVMYFVHSDYPMYRLTHISDSNWILAAVDFGIHPPLLPENFIDEWTIQTVFPVNSDGTPAWLASNSTYPSGIPYKAGNRVLYASKKWVCQKDHTGTATKAPGLSTATYNDTSNIISIERPLWIETFADESSVIGQDITLKASVDTWTQDHVGAAWEIAKKRNSKAYDSQMVFEDPGGGSGSTSTYSPVIIVQGGWTFNTFGTWYGTYIIEKSEDRGKTWEEIRRYEAITSSPRTVATEGTEEKRVLMRFKYTFGSRVGSSNPYAILSATDAKIRGVVKIKTYISPKEVIATTLSPVELATSYYWSEGAWSKVQGYPSCIDTHQARLVVAATKLRPHSIWGSAVDDYPNFYIGTDADMAYFHTIPVGERDPILWLVSEKCLLVGTGSGEFVMTGENDEAAITPEFGTAKRQSSYGSHQGGASAIFSDSVALFIQRGGTRIREFSYRFEQDRYEASNLSILADHLFDGKAVTDVAVQRMPFQVIWFISNGKLFGLTYERMQQVAAWHRHETEGSIISVATIRTAGNEDEVWFLVDRGNGLLVERFHPGGLHAPENDGWWSDSAVSIPLPADFTRAAHLAGSEIYGFASGRFYGPALFDGSSFPFITGMQISGVTGDPSASGFYPVAGERNGKWWYRLEGNATEDFSIQWILNPSPRWVIYWKGSIAWESDFTSQRPDEVPVWATFPYQAPDGLLTVSPVTAQPGGSSMVLGLRYNAAYFPMKPEIPLQNGSSRSREVKIHRIVPSVYKSRSGKYGETPDGELLPLNAGSETELFTGEIEKGFPGHFSTDGNFCLVSDEPVPFAIRSTAIKFNVLGDGD